MTTYQTLGGIGSALDGAFSGAAPVVAAEREHVDAALMHAFKRCSRLAALLVLAVGLCGMLSGLHDLAVFKTVPSGWVAVRIGIPFGLCVAGAALWLWNRESGKRPFGRRAALALGWTAAGIGAVILGETIVAELSRYTGAEAVPSLASPLAALDLALLGFAQGGCDAQTRSGRRPAVLLAIMAGWIAAAALIGHIYRVGAILPPNSGGVMDIPTALAFCLLSIGILYARPDHGLMTLWVSGSAGGLLVRHLLPVSLLVPVALSSLVMLGGRQGLFRAELVPPLSLIVCLLTITALIWWYAKSLHRMENELCDRDQRLKYALEEAQIGEWELNLENYAIRRSPRHDVIFGYTGLQPDWSYRTFIEHVHPDDRERIDRHFWEMLETARAWDEEFRIVGPDRGERWIRACGNVFRDASGKPGRFAGIVQDITALKQAEWRLREVDRHKDEFLAMLAHELRNPLTPMLTAAQLLERQGVDDPKLVHWAGEVIQRQGWHLAYLIGELLDVARVSRGKITLQTAPLDLREVVRRAVETHQPLIDKHAHAFSLSLPPEPMLVEADAVRLEQVVGNILNNAVKYTPDGGRIRLMLEKVERGCVIRVRDSGVGIEPVLLPKVFDLFTQAERGPDRAQGGLGIGLALVKSLIAMHGGSVEAHSGGAGQGSEFVVRLPRRSIPIRPAPTTPAGVLGAKDAPSRRILVVDDNVDIATSMATLLETSGHEVRVAYSGLDALDIARTNPLDIVFLDIGMPGLNGYKVARRLREEPGFGRPKLIAMTGYDKKRDREESRSAGFDHHLVKPVDPARLAELLAPDG